MTLADLVPSLANVRNRRNRRLFAGLAPGLGSPGRALRLSARGMGHRRLLAFLLAAAAVLSPAAEAWAWGATGHRVIGQVAMEALPEEVPAFLRAPGVAAEIGELARELDRSKGAGKTHDAHRDPSHFVDVDDAGRVLGGPPLNALPETLLEYDAALLAAGTDRSKAGWLTYALVDGWQQLVKDFAHWRVLVAAERLATTPERRAWYAEDRARRERLIINNLGVWAHYVGDASQPHHTTIHYNGWAGPNPKGYTTSRQTHGAFEGAFVKANLDVAAVRTALPPPDPVGPIREETAEYIGQTLAFVEPFYALEKAGGFNPGDPRGVQFATARLAAGAGELRDLTVAAWRASETAQVGYPVTPVADFVSGKVDPWDALYGRD
jgi:hypothetical protein